MNIQATTTRRTTTTTKAPRRPPTTTAATTLYTSYEDTEPEDQDADDEDVGEEDSTPFFEGGRIRKLTFSRAIELVDRYIQSYFLSFHTKLISTNAIYDLTHA